ncbi:MAG: ArnT family glycosyltransferase [Cyclobacteriaceae bacterium]
MLNNQEYKNYLLGLLILLYLVSIFAPLNVLPLSFEEPRRGIVALEMMISGNYIVPTINGELYLNKPPLYNWLLIGLFKLTGSYAEWVVRLPTVFSLLAIAGFNFYFTRKYLNHQVAILSSLLFLTSADIYYYFSLYGEIDMLYSLIVYLQIASIYIFYQRRNYRLLFLVSYFLTGLGLLTKGMPSLAFQALTLLAGAIAVKEFRRLFSPAHFAGILMLLVMVGGYFFWYGQYADPLAFIANLVNESTQRTAADKSWWQSIEHLFTFPFLLIRISLPWILLIIPLFFKGNLNKLKNNTWLIYGVIFILANIIIYWLSPGTKNRYLYMFLPFIFNIVSFALVSINSEYLRFNKIFYWFFGAIMAIVTAGLLVLPFLKIKEAEQLELISLLFLIPSAFILYSFIRKPAYRILLLLFFMVLIRFFFNATVIPYRAAGIAEGKPIKQEMEKILEKFNGVRLYLHAPYRIKKLKLNIPLLINYENEFQELLWPPFSLSYYYTAETGEMLIHEEDLKIGRLYIAEAKYLTYIKKFDILYSFTANKRNTEFVVFRL